MRKSSALSSGTQVLRKQQEWQSKRGQVGPCSQHHDDNAAAPQRDVALVCGLVHTLENQPRVVGDGGSRIKSLLKLTPMTSRAETECFRSFCYGVWHISLNWMHSVPVRVLALAEREA